MAEVRLSNGIDVAHVDDADLPVVEEHRWSLWSSKGKENRYAIANVRIDGKKTTMQMHRLIMRAKPGEQVDHIDGDGLNNRRANLRLANRNGNQQNQRKTRGASRFKGVSYWNVKGRTPYWTARISVEGKRKLIGYFKTDVEAARAYDAAARECFGEFACTNDDLGLYDKVDGG